ncbi:MAG: hypothetical protein GQ565_03565 [Candidatus Aegiribacteria sp.]|nr:hypothetical protein [Candidatus Aegiribacteria sp.]
MRFIRSAIITLFITGTISAALPRIAVVSIDFDEFAPDSVIVGEVIDKLAESGRFQVVELGDDSFVDTSPDSLLSSLRTLSAARGIDVILAMEILYPEENDRTVFRNDSLLTYRTVSVDVLGRFYSSTATLIGTIRNTVTREEILPYSPDTYRLAILSARELASRAVLELFPIEVTFTASDSEVFTIPLGRDQGISKGTVMAVVASSTRIPDNIYEYEYLRSRGLLQIMCTEAGQSTARLISGRLVDGGTVTAIEQSAPAILFLEYSGLMMSVEPGTGLEDDIAEWSNNVRLGIETSKWGLSFGGGVTAGGLEHSSLIGIDLQLGTRIPLSSPSFGLRLSAGSELAFLMQDVRSNLLSSSATAVSVAAVADVTMEYLFSGHLGFQIGVSGVLGTAADSWTVREYSGNIRDAEPDELYYTELKQGPAGIHAGLMYFIF